MAPRPGYQPIFIAFGPAMISTISVGAGSAAEASKRTLTLAVLRERRDIFGDARKAFMKDCMKNADGKSATPPAG